MKLYALRHFRLPKFSLSLPPSLPNQMSTAVYGSTSPHPSRLDLFIPEPGKLETPLGPNLGQGGGLSSTKRKEESSSAFRPNNDSSVVKSKAESAAAFRGLLERFWLKLERVRSAIRPNLSDREKGAKGTLEGWSGRNGEVDSGGPQPSDLNGTSLI